MKSEHEFINEFGLIFFQIFNHDDHNNNNNIFIITLTRGIIVFLD